jgi:hypothetical protein
LELINKKGYSIGSLNESKYSFIPSDDNSSIEFVTPFIDIDEVFSFL